MSARDEQVEAQVKPKRGSRNEDTTSTIAQTIDACFCEVEMLFEEMEEWRDNMSCNEMAHLPKYEEVDTAASELEQLKDELEPLRDLVEGDSLSEGLHESLAGLTVSYTQDTRRKAYSRSGRIGNAARAGEAVSEALDDLVAWLSEAEDDLENEESTMELEDALGQWRDAMECSVQDICFPGMF